MVGVKHRSVGRRSDRLAVQLHLLLWVPQLQGAGALVGRGLLAVRQADGGRQVDDALRQVGVRRLEAARGVHVLEALRRQVGVRLRLRLLRLPLQVGGGSASVGRAGVVHLVLWRRRRTRERGLGLRLAEAMLARRVLPTRGSCRTYIVYAAVCPHSFRGPQASLLRETQGTCSVEG